MSSIRPRLEAQALRVDATYPERLHRERVLPPYGNVDPEPNTRTRRGRTRPPRSSRRNGPAPRKRPSVTVTTTSRKPARNAGIGDGDAKTFPTARDAVAELERRHGPRSTTWTYHDAGGDPVGLVVRWNTPTGKDVRPVSRKGGGADGSGWIIGGMPTPRPLYGLPDLLATKPGDRVYVTEGEKAADAARVVGLVATTSPHGSKSAGKADWSPVAGREVVILPDHDDAGERYADDVVRLAIGAGAKSVRVVRLVELWAGMPEGGDMADLVEHRRGAAGTLTRSAPKSKP